MTWEVAKDLVLGSLGTAFFAFFMKEMQELRKSVESLNNKIATMIEKTTHHENTLHEHSRRIVFLERGGS